jgi:hypothetical protein
MPEAQPPSREFTVDREALEALAQQAPAAAPATDGNAPAERAAATCRKLLDSGAVTAAGIEPGDVEVTADDGELVLTVAGRPLRLPLVVLDDATLLELQARAVAKRLSAPEGDALIWIHGLVTHKT